VGLQPQAAEQVRCSAVPVAAQVPPELAEFAWAGSCPAAADRSAGVVLPAERPAVALRALPQAGRFAASAPVGIVAAARAAAAREQRAGAPALTPPGRPAGSAPAFHRPQEPDGQFVFVVGHPGSCPSQLQAEGAQAARVAAASDAVVPPVEPLSAAVLQVARVEAVPALPARLAAGSPVALPALISVARPWGIRPLAVAARLWVARAVQAAAQFPRLTVRLEPG
jgi:hypothetical protein